MKTRYTLGVVLVSAIMVGGCAKTTGSGSASATYDFTDANKLAVVAIKGKLKDEAAKGQITDIFNQKFLQKGYSPVGRTQIKSVLKEQQFQNNQLTSASGASKIGNVLNVDAAMIVNVPKYKNKMSISAKLVDVETGEIVWSGSGTARTGKGLAQAGGVLAGAILGGTATGAATDSSSGAAAGAAGGGAAGGLAGTALSPQKQKQARKLINKLLKSLPPSTSTGSTT